MPLETGEQWTRKGQLSDFKIAHRVGMGGFSALRQVREGAEYKYVTTGDKQATLHWRPMASCSVSPVRPLSMMI